MLFSRGIRREMCEDVYSVYDRVYYILWVFVYPLMIILFNKAINVLSMIVDLFRFIRISLILKLT